MKFRVGVIGIGNMGSSHTRKFIEGKIPNAEITAFCDIDPEKLFRFREEFGNRVQYFQKSDDLIHSGLVDGVIIATPHYDHPLIAIEAFRAGLHVFCEKPAGVFTKNVRQMNEEAQKSGKVFQVNFVMRATNDFKTIKELIDRNELGQLRRITWIKTDWYRTQKYYDSGTWRATWAGEGGGTLINQNPHQLDLLQWFSGTPKRVRAFCYFGKRRNIEVEDEVTAYMEYENGLVATYITSVSEYPGTNRLEIVGENGKLVYEQNHITLYKTAVGESQFNLETQSGTGPIPMEKYDIPFTPSAVSDCQGEMISNWVDAALYGTPLIAPGYEGIRSLAMINAMYLSQWKDKWVELPFDENEFMEELQERIQTSTYRKQSVASAEFDMDRSYAK